MKLRHHRKAIRGRRNWRSGATTVEFALVANVAFVMIMGCMEFARVNTIRNLTQDAAYYAARYVIVPGASESEAVEEAERVLNAVISDGYTIEVSPIDFETEEVTVTVRVDFDQVGFFTPMFVPHNATIDASVRMKTERYTGFYEN